MSDRIYRRVRAGSDEHRLLKDAWLSFDGAWEGVPILAVWQTEEGWAVSGFSGDEGPPDEVIDLLIGEPCDERGRSITSG